MASIASQLVQSGTFLFHYTAYLLLGILVFAAFGPDVIPLPGAPHAIIREASSEVRVPRSHALEGPYAMNTLLEKSTVLFNNTLRSSETVQVDPDGTLYMMDKYGYVFKAAPDVSAPGGYALDHTPITHVGTGRPLGFKRLPDGGDFIVCVAGQGLVQVHVPVEGVADDRARVKIIGSVVSLDSPIDPGTRIEFANSVDITSDGSVVYFTDSQVFPAVDRNYDNPRYPWFDTMASALRGFFTATPSGRLLAYYPHNGTIHVLVKGFFFTNGIALSEDESHVVICETFKMRLLKYWIKRSKAGTLEIFTEGLPGTPDGVSRALNGKGYWLVLPGPRTQLFEKALDWKIIRVLMAYLPKRFHPHIENWGAAVLVNTHGQAVKFLVDPSGKTVSQLSAVFEVPLNEARSRLWFGTVDKHYTAYIDVDAADGTPVEE